MPNETIRRKVRNAAELDRALQANPELDLSTGRATGSQIALTAFACLAIIALVIYGLNNQRNETAATAPSANATQTPGETTGAGRAAAGKITQRSKAGSTGTR